jgi:hypothetical protein
MTRANIILNQLGGINKIAAMTGAYNFLNVESGVSFRIKARAANYVKVTVNESDLYNVTIGKISGMNYKVVASASGVYAADLKKYIETKTETRFTL